MLQEELLHSLRFLFADLEVVWRIQVDQREGFHRALHVKAVPMDHLASFATSLFGSASVQFNSVAQDPFVRGDFSERSTIPGARIERATLLPTELRLAFKLRVLELRTAHAPTADLRSLERAFNILARPGLRACYDTILDDPSSPPLFPCGGFGSLLVAGDVSRDGSTFYASRILSFLPDQKFKHFRASLRNVAFYNDHAIYRDSRRKLEVLFDQASLPLLWDSSWNQWKHLLGTKIGVKATFIQSGKYQHRAGAWHLAQWETALPSRIEVALPSNIAEQIADARKTHHRFGEYAEALDIIRVRIESAPVERADLQKLCIELGMPGDFDVALITWKP